MKRRVRKKNIKAPAWLFLTAMILVYEGFLYFGTMDSFVPQRLCTVMIFALGFGCALSLIVSLFPPKIQKRITLVMVPILALLYIVQYFIHDAYQVFMTFGGVLGGAENVATNYLDVVLGLLGRNLWKILLLVLPIFLFGKYARVPKTRWIQRFCLLGVAVSMYLMGFGMVYRFGVDADKFAVSTSFDNAVTCFGLNMGLGMDLLQSSGEEELEFDNVQMEVPVFPDPTQPPVPVDTQVPEETRIPGETLLQGETEAPTQPEEPTQPPRVFEPHDLGLDFAALAAAESNKRISPIHSYMATQTPAMENEYTGLFEGKNLIIITAEAFSPYVVDQERTPALYRMMTEGIYFTDYYQPLWGSGTTGGEYSNLLSLVPYNSSKSMMEVTEQNIFHTMGKQLQAQGYTSAAFHNNDYTYYSRHKTHTHLGYDVFIGEGNGMEKGISHIWPQSDEEMFRYTIPQYIDKQPFSLYYMTVSGHATYIFKNNGAARRNKAYVEDLDYPDPIKAYLACNMELEHSMAYLLQELEAKDIMDDTVVVIATDHYPYGLAPSDTWSSKRDYLAELIGQDVDDSFIRDKSTLIIWSGCLEDMDLQVDDPTMSLDILPTLSNLFGVDYDSRLMCGRDVFSTQQPLAFWLDGSWKTDKGSYNGNTGKFTPEEGVEVDQTYLDNIRSSINNRCNYSKAVSYYNYFNYITPELERMNVIS